MSSALPRARGARALFAALRAPKGGGGRRELHLPRVIGGTALLLGVLGVSQVVFEYVLSSLATTHDFENYVTLRNLLLVFSAVAPLGLNELQVRRGSTDLAAGLRVLRLNYAVTLVLALVFLLAPVPFLQAPGMPPAPLVAGCLLAFSLCQSVSHVFRARHRFVLALLLRDGWRLLLWASLAGLLLAGNAALGVSYTFLAAIGAAVVVCTVYLARRYAAEARGRSIPAVSRGEIRLALTFWLTTVSLTAVTYADQLMLQRLARTAGELKAYALCVTLVVMPAVMVSSAAGAVLLPAVAAGRRVRPALAAAARQALGRRGVAAAAAAALVLAAGYLASRFLLARVGVTLGPGLFALLVLTGAARVAYSLPSAVIGAVGGVRMVGTVGALDCVVVALQVPGTVLLYRAMGMPGVALATLLAWAMRLGVSGAAIRRLDF